MNFQILKQYLCLIALFIATIYLPAASEECITDLTSFVLYNSSFPLRTKISHLEGLLSLNSGDGPLTSRLLKLNSEPIELINQEQQILFVNRNKRFKVTQVQGGHENEGIYAFSDDSDNFIIKIFPKNTNNPIELLLNSYYAELIGGAKVYGFGQTLDGRYYVQQTHLFKGKTTTTLKSMLKNWQQGNIPLDLPLDYVDDLALKLGALIVKAFEEKITPHDPDLIFSLEGPGVAWIDSARWSRYDPLELIRITIHQRIIFVLGLIDSNLYYPLLQGILVATSASLKLGPDDKKMIITTALSLIK
ncbi:MAG: hypothetical protein ISR65_10585 [Bacteriovoracaceae bacterium]|nr:hypothetical protein [Bacteriovoracaceae bacterium]